MGVPSLRRLTALSTYLGHVSIEATHWYLQTTAELLADIATAGEKFLAGERP
jgi:integrase/recombinase XerD